MNVSMGPAGLEVFDKTLEKTGAWLTSIMVEMGWENRHLAYSVLRSVLHALRDRLTRDEAVHLAAQLPMLIRGFYYEGWHPAGQPLKYRHKDEFLNQVSKQCPEIEGSELERAVSAVFGLLSDQIHLGETRHIRNQLPIEVRELWPLKGL